MFCVFVFYVCLFVFTRDFNAFFFYIPLRFSNKENKFEKKQNQNKKGGIIAALSYCDAYCPLCCLMPFIGTIYAIADCVTIWYCYVFYEAIELLYESEVEIYGLDLTSDEMRNTALKMLIGECIAFIILVIATCTSCCFARNINNQTNVQIVNVNHNNQMQHHKYVTIPQQQSIN